jgi:hypothetical protein
MYNQETQCETGLKIMRTSHPRWRKQEKLPLVLFLPPWRQVEGEDGYM